MEHLRGVVERITYQNPENGYSVIKCRVKNYADLVTVVGSMPQVHVGSVLYMGGSWRVDPKYGRQFSMETFEETLPATTYGIEKYLGSGLVKGIGPKFAKKIVQQFGKDTLDVIEEDPDKLLEVPGIGKVRVERVKKSWSEQKEIKNIMLFLQSHDVSTSHATKIYKTYGNDSIKIVQENPYRLADDIWGIGFKTADTIAEKMGFGHEKYVRLRSGILYTLNKLSEDGHCYATRDMLLKSGTELLGVEDNLLSISLDEMVRAGDVITEELPLPADASELQEPEKAIYLPPFYFSEVGTVKRLQAILTNTSGIRIQSAGLAQRIQKKTGMQYDAVQLQAIHAAVQSKILVLTGGPGTGKTTTTLGIITAFREAGAKVLLAAPTGRAAKRLSEATGMEAKTIHRLLEVKPPEGYQRNEENPLEGDVLIVDECSMIDIMLMYNLLKAVPDSMTLILVGDIDQLPSVGAGNVLRDIIASGRFPMVRLTRIFRQAQQSRIIMNAHRINEGKMPDISNGRTADFFFMDMEKAARQEGLAPDDTAAIAQLTADTIVGLVQTKLPRYYHTPSREIQVLTPMQRGVVGAGNLNLLLQEAINPGNGSFGQGGYQDDSWNGNPAGDRSGNGNAVGGNQQNGNFGRGYYGNGNFGQGCSEGLKRAGIEYRQGDKVMQIRNNYDKEVFNGDIGIIDSVDVEEKSLAVNFDERTVEYDISELDELVLAYATTIHKAQGSEYPIVVMPLLMNHFVMLQRNLVYTGITRAKKILVIVGTKRALAYSVKHVTVTKRNTMLRERLQKALPAWEGMAVQEELSMQEGAAGWKGFPTQEEGPLHEEKAVQMELPLHEEKASRGGKSSQKGQPLPKKQASRGSGSSLEKTANQASDSKDADHRSVISYSAAREETEPGPKVAEPNPMAAGSNEDSITQRLSHEKWLRQDLFLRISKSSFRSRFHLSEKDKQYVRDKGMDTIESHARDFVAKRLAPAVIPNDGKQTPMRGHPVFIAQHATGCCCRGCLYKWHGIPAGHELTQEEQDYVVGVLMKWIKRQMGE